MSLLEVTGLTHSFGDNYHTKISKEGFNYEGILEHDPSHFCGHRRVARLLPGRLRRASDRSGGVRGSGLHHGRDVCRGG